MESLLDMNLKVFVVHITIEKTYFGEDFFQTVSNQQTN